MVSLEFIVEMVLCKLNIVLQVYDGVWGSPDFGWSCA